jgi:hypothetical protein
LAFNFTSGFSLLHQTWILGDLLPLDLCMADIIYGLKQTLASGIVHHTIDMFLSADTFEKILQLNEGFLNISEELFQLFLVLS